MAGTWHRVRTYLRHLVKARSRHGVHSPFIYALMDEVLCRDAPLAEVKDIEQRRRRLQASRKRIHVTDLGAGSSLGLGTERSVGAIARSALKPPRQARLLYRLVRHFRPGTVLELGTSLGITTAYLARAAEPGMVFTLEGCPNTLAVAREGLEELGIGNVEAVEGAFSDTLPGILERIGHVDLAFIDGHHDREATLGYFEHVLARSHEGTVLVFDDIHWSPGMSQAWARIQEHPRATVTADLYHLGLVFLRGGQARQHFRLRC
ncbi:MAG TPA: class I SAM-dependent methyltransferase [Flavobacteriales bacterium]|nr:class I SAM-dependent methyltransferase [Flavobacteriales bacterium]HRW88853.1 class I SAM-dependent methyltransferase [Flavobacteriales bacterium]